jgi:hypothetical protein
MIFHLPSVEELNKIYFHWLLGSGTNVTPEPAVESIATNQPPLTFAL